VEPLFDLLDIFAVRTRVDFAFLQDYLRTTIAATYSLQHRRQARAPRCCMNKACICSCRCKGFPDGHSS
jgi:hypothetical protein